MSSVPTGNGFFSRSPRRDARRVARGTPRVRMPMKVSSGRSLWRSAISCAIRSIIRRMRSASRMRVFLISPSANVRRVYGLSSSRVKDGLELTEKMVFYNASTKELTAKIVYYGPGLGGKTTNLQLLHDRLDPHTVGKLVTLSTRTDRTIYFDLLPVELGEIKGYKIRFQLATVPGQTAFNETRKVVLRGADGIVFVADSRRPPRNRSNGLRTLKIGSRPKSRRGALPKKPQMPLWRACRPAPRSSTRRSPESPGSSRPSKPLSTRRPRRGSAKPRTSARGASPGPPAPGRAEPASGRTASER